MPYNITLIYFADHMNLVFSDVGSFFVCEFLWFVKRNLSWLFSNCIISLIITNYVIDVNMFSLVISWCNYNTQDDVMNILQKS